MNRPALELPTAHFLTIPDFKNNTILIDHQLQKMRDTAEYILVPTKTDRPRNITVTADIYAHVSDRMKQESASKMERFIRSVSG